MTTTKNKRGARRKFHPIVLRCKFACGVKTVCCQTCAFVSFDCSGSDDPQEEHWEVCSLDERMEGLKHFPFKNGCKRWRPDFWHTKFADEINGNHEHDIGVARRFRLTMEMIPQND